MKAYFDTSAFGLLAFADKGYDILDRWIAENTPELCFSDFGFGEFVSAVGRRVRANDLTDVVGEALLVEAKTYLRSWSFAPITSNDVEHAAAVLANFRLNLRLPDAIHIATARRIDAVLVSIDRHQFRAARTLGYLAINPLFNEIAS